MDHTQTSPPAVQFTELPDCLLQRDDGVVVVRGYRVSLHLLIDRIRHGETAASVADEFSVLPLETVECVFDFYQRHQDWCDGYYAWCESRMVELDAAGPSLSELRDRRASQRDD